MREIVDQLKEWVLGIGWSSMLRAAIFVLVGLFFARLAAGVMGRMFGGRVDKQQTMLLRRLAFYPILLLSITAALREVGFDMSVFLGAAGLFTVALGFASQTSASNLISGLFLIGERSFVVGDFIEVGGVTGEVLSIDLLSAKVRTFDNLYVRIPNETLVKSNVTNLSRFPIRRLDLVLRVGYRSDLSTIRALLLDVIANEPRVLDEPKPLFFAQEFEPTGVRLQFSVWCRREIFFDVRATLQAEIRKRFNEEGVESPAARWTMDGTPPV
ncbi:MAG: mechanosensitive ion channel family protein [Myxococcales bacterium]|nr:mechanosensitive ion channel family protein [Myxococcales bacterium]